MHWVFVIAVRPFYTTVAEAAKNALIASVVMQSLEAIRAKFTGYCSSRKMGRVQILLLLLLLAKGRNEICTLPVSVLLCVCHQKQRRRGSGCNDALHPENGYG